MDREDINGKIKTKIINHLERMIIMKEISSFTIDHLRLLPGIYVSRKDQLGKETITTFDLRITRPNHESPYAYRRDSYY